MTITFLALRSRRRSQYLALGILFGIPLTLIGIGLLLYSWFNPTEGIKTVAYPYNLQVIDPVLPVDLVYHKDDRKPNQISPEEHVAVSYPNNGRLQIHLRLPNSIDALQGLWRGREASLVATGAVDGKFAIAPGNDTVVWEDNVMNLERKVSPDAFAEIPLDQINLTSSPANRTFDVHVYLKVAYPDKSLDGSIVNQNREFEHHFSVTVLSAEELASRPAYIQQARWAQVRLIAPYAGSLLFVGLAMIFVPLYVHWRMGTPISLRRPSETNPPPEQPSQEKTEPARKETLSSD